MSWRRRFKFKTRSVRSRLASFGLPKWLTGAAARLIVTVAVVGLGVAYILVTNAAATSGYEIQRLEKQIDATDNELRRLSAEVAAAQSMGSIQKRLPELTMVPVAEIRHLRLVNDLVVAKR